MNHKDTVAFDALVIGFSLLLTVFLPVVFSFVAWVSGFGLSWWEFPLGVAVSLFVAWRLGGSWRSPLIVLACLAMTMLVDGLIYDYAYDSLLYHKDTVALLAQGWNPLDYGNYPDVSLWTLHYAKLLEISASSIYAFTGILETGKAVAMLLVGSLAAIGYHTLVNLDLSRRKTLAVMFVLLCNPVLTTQMFTFYIDFSLYVYLSVTCLTLINIHMRRYVRLNAIILVVVTVMAIGTKFNIFFYQGLAMLAAMGWFVCTRDYKTSRILLIAGLSGLVAGVILFIHPYVTNWLGWGHPLYPLLGDGSVDIMVRNTHPLYQGHNRVVNFFLNLFSPQSRLFPFTSCGARVGGFSHVGGILLVFALMLLVRGWKKFPAVAYYAMAVTLLSCFCFEQAWWARYIPQLWLIPTIAILCELKYGTARPILVKSFLALVACALLLSGVAQLGMLVFRSF